MRRFSSEKEKELICIVLYGKYTESFEFGVWALHMLVRV